MADALLGSTGEARARDGRRIAFVAVGPRDGSPVLYLHGAIGSPRWRTPGLEALIVEHRIRYVVVNRPGFGGSDPCPGRTVADFAFDVRDVVDMLDFGHFSVMGVSAGAPYALACAWAMPERVTATAAVSPLVSGFGPGGAGGPRYRVPGELFSAPGLGPAVAGAALRLLGLGGSTNPRAMIEDYEVCRRPWGFDPGEIAAPVSLSHGQRDRLVPLDHALRLGAVIPDCTIRPVPGGGHFFLSQHLPEIVGPLVTARSGEDQVERFPLAA
jgi:pimeloyl-ACP methyl ester carboxylesterase